MPAIRVVARFRPINKNEKQIKKEKIASGEWPEDIKIDCCVTLKDPKFKSDIPEGFKGPSGNVVRVDLDDGNPPRPFTVDSVWPPTTQQKDFFNDIGLPMVEKALNGINSTSFCYGQTGAGKSFSMFGAEPMHETSQKCPDLLGVLPRAASLAFERCEANKTEGVMQDYKIYLECYEIYLDVIYDLLPKNGPPRTTPLVKKEVAHVMIIGLSKYEIADVAEILIKVTTGYSNRHTAPTKMNPASSRGHCIFIMTMEQVDPDGTKVGGKMSFIDLAGSEKMAKTGITDPQRIQEAKMINGSLTYLGKVIRALVKRKKSVPFRENCLPHCLKESLIGNCVTTLVTALSPHRYNCMETANTLRFGMAARCLVNKVKANKQLSPKQMAALLEKLKVRCKAYEAALKGAGIDPASVDPNAAEEKEAGGKKKKKAAAGGGGGGALADGQVGMSAEDVQRLKDLEEQNGQLQGQVQDMQEKMDTMAAGSQDAKKATEEMEAQIASLVAEKAKDLFGKSVDGILGKNTYIRLKDLGDDVTEEKLDEGVDLKTADKIIEASTGDRMAIAGLLEWQRILLKRGMDKAKGDAKKALQVMAHNDRKIQQSVNDMLKDIKDGQQNLKVIAHVKEENKNYIQQVENCRLEIKDLKRAVELYQGSSNRLKQAQIEIMKWRNMAREGGGGGAVSLLAQLEDDERNRDQSIKAEFDAANRLAGKNMSMRDGVESGQAAAAYLGGGGARAGEGGVDFDNYHDEWAEEKAELVFDPDLGRKMVYRIPSEEVAKWGAECKGVKLANETSCNRKMLREMLPKMGHTHINILFSDLNVRGDGIIKMSQVQGFLDGMKQRETLEDHCKKHEKIKGLDKGLCDLVKQSMLINETDMMTKESVDRVMEGADLPDALSEQLFKIASQGEKEIPGYIWKTTINNLSKNTGGNGLTINIPLEETGKQDMGDAFHMSVDLSKIFKKHGKKGKSGMVLNKDGAKHVLAGLRDCKHYQVRDEDAGMDYLEGFSEDQIMDFVANIHHTMWEILSNFNHYERLFVLFEGLDQGGGKVSFESFMKGMRKIGVEAGDDILKNMFNTMDKDKNGTMDYTEFAAFLESADIPTEFFKIRRELQTVISIPMQEKEDFSDIDIAKLQNDPYEWNAGRVSAWLDTIGGQAYKQAFLDNNINGIMLLKDVGEDDLKTELGVKGMWIKKILAARDDLREESVRYQDDLAIQERAEIDRLMESAAKKRAAADAIGGADAQAAKDDAAAILGGIAFDTLGNDVSFELDFPAFKVQLKNFGVKLSENQMRTVFEKMDADHGGTLDYKEFMKFLQLRDAFGIVDPGQGAGPPVRKEMVAKATMVIGACFKQGKKRRDVVQFLEKKGVSKKEINIAFANYVSDPNNVPSLDVKQSEKVEFDDFKLLKLMRRVGVETKGHDKFNDVNFYRNLNAPANVNVIEVWFDSGSKTMTGFHTSYIDSAGKPQSAVNHYFVHEDMSPEKFTLKLEKDEFLVGCEIWTHGTDETQVCGVKFTTNQRVNLEYGVCSEMSDGCLIAPEGSCLIAFYGSIAEGLVESLGAYVVRNEPGAIDPKTGKILSAAQCKALGK